MSSDNEYRVIADAGLGGISSVVSALPSGFNLGETRVQSGIKYKLVHNAGNSQATVGAVVAPIGSAGPYSVTVSTASRTNAHIGAGIVVHATLTTGSFGWVGVEGRIGAVLGGTTSIPTGSAAYIGDNGALEIMPQSVVTGNIVIGVNLGASASKTVTTGALTGDLLVTGLLS